MNMDALKLNEHELRVYAELFSVCDTENTGKVTGVKASELFLTSGLSQETLLQITDLCGAKRLGHFGRSQFYIALKLIAAVQCGLPATFESLNSGLEIPLPMFGRQIELTQSGYNQMGGSTDIEYYATDRVPGGGLSGLPPPPPPKPVRPHPLQQSQPQPQPPRVIPGYDSQYDQTDSQRDSRTPPFSPKESPPLSPADSKSDMKPPPPVPPTAGGSVYANNQFNNSHAPGRVEKGWASFEDDAQALLTEEPKPVPTWTQFSDHGDAQAETSSISSEAESIDDVWAITDEQREYYVNQFASMQPELGGVISGAVAKDFFEKSKLPVQELAKIWQLSDVDRDGALSLEEFCIAMHLVVLRRNDIELPANLPPALIPYVPLVNVNPEEPFGADLPPGSNLQIFTPSSPPPSQWPPQSFPPESPTSSSMSSPGNKPAPVNFEFKPVAADPDSKIIHPVALRMSPEGHPITLDVEGKPRAFSDGNIKFECRESGKEGISNHLRLLHNRQVRDRANSDYCVQPTAKVSRRPRPAPPTLRTRRANTITGAEAAQSSSRIIPPPGRALDGSEVVEGTAPPPPPRKSGHSRSSSLDNQLLDHPPEAKGSLMAPPAVPPRPSPKDGVITVGPNKKLVTQASEPTFSSEGGASNFADFSQFEPIPPHEMINGQVGSATVAECDRLAHPANLEYSQQAPSSFVPYHQGGPGPGGGEHTDSVVVNDRPPSPARRSSRDEISREDTDKTKIGRGKLPRQGSQDKKDLQGKVRKLRERNLGLSRLNKELNQELQEVMEQRIALEIQLEHLRPFSS